MLDSTPNPPIPERVSVTICGDGGCGKSSITLRLVRSQWTSTYDPTIEDSYSVTRTIDGLPVNLSLTDTAGQEEYRGLITSSSMSSHAFLLVYDITNPSSLYDQLPYFHDLVQQERDTRAEGIIRSPAAVAGEPSEWATVEPIVIVAGNKCDLKEERAVTSAEGLRWAREHGCGFMETSARDCVNVEETFALIVRRVREAREQDRLVRSGASPKPAAIGSPRSPGGQSYDAGTEAAAHAGVQPYGAGAEKGLALDAGANAGSAGATGGGFWKSGRWWRWAKCW